MNSNQRSIAEYSLLVLGGIILVAGALAAIGTYCWIVYVAFAGGRIPLLGEFEGSIVGGILALFFAEIGTGLVFFTPCSLFVYGVLAPLGERLEKQRSTGNTQR